MAKKDATPPAPQVTLDEFVKSIAHRGTRAGFAAIMAPERTVTRTEAEWNTLLSLFKTRPIAVPWPQWVNNQGGK